MFPVKGGLDRNSSISGSCRTRVLLSFVFVAAASLCEAQPPSRNAIDLRRLGLPVVDFEDQATGTDITTQYAARGITFLPATGVVYRIRKVDQDYATSGSHVLEYLYPGTEMPVGYF